MRDWHWKDYWEKVYKVGLHKKEIESSSILGKRQAEESNIKDEVNSNNTPPIKGHQTQIYECQDTIEYEIGDPVKKGDTVTRLSHLFHDSNNFYTKFQGYNRRVGCNLIESQSIKGTMKIIDINYKGIICRGQYLSLPQV